MRRRVLVSIVLLGCCTSAADAAVVRVHDGIVEFRAGPGEFNVVVVGRRSSGVTVADLQSGVRAGRGCIALSAQEAHCETGGRARARVSLADGDDLFVVDGTMEVRAALGDGNDDAEVRRGTLIADGGAGFDEIAGGPGADVLRGGDGADEVRGGDGADLLRGGAGEDELLGGPGADRLHGGDADDVLDGGAGGDLLDGGGGRDRTSYAGRRAGVVVTIGSGADDGEAGEGDDVRDSTEVVVGSDGDDRITAGAVRALLDGGGGDDHVSGGPGDDRLDGGDGDDVLAGGSGNDRLVGGTQASSDDLDCGDGDDIALRDDDEAPRACERVLTPITRAQLQFQISGGPKAFVQGTWVRTAGSAKVVAVRVVARNFPRPTVPIAVVVRDGSGHVVKRFRRSVAPNRLVTIRAVRVPSSARRATARVVTSG